MKEILKERARRLKNMQEEKGGIPVLDRFDKSMGGMPDEDFKKFVAAQLKKIEDELEMAEEEDIPGLDYEHPDPRSGRAVCLWREQAKGTAVSPFIRGGSDAGHGMVDGGLLSF